MGADQESSSGNDRSPSDWHAKNTDFFQNAGHNEINDSTFSF
jgi:hypothetical protein